MTVSDTLKLGRTSDVCVRIVHSQKHLIGDE